MQIGESFSGAGVNAAHINTVLGSRDGPVGTAWVTALATPRAGHASFVVIARRSLAACPPTLFVNKAMIENDSHADLTWGPAQAGVAQGVGRAVEDGTVERERVGELLLIAAVWVNPAADDAGAVYENNAAATHEALRNGRSGGPDLDEFLAAAKSPSNPFFEAK